MTIDLASLAEQLMEEDRLRYPGLRGLHPSHFDRLRNDILRQLETRVDLSVQRRLISIDRACYEELISVEGREAALAWCQLRIPDFEGYLSEILLAFRQEYSKGKGDGP